MLRKIFMAVALFMMTLTFTAENVCAEEVAVYNDEINRTTYCVEDSTIAYTNSDIAFKVKVITYEKTYSPQEDWCYFEEEEDGTWAYVIGEGGRAHTVKRADEPAYSVFKFCIKHLHSRHHNQPLAGA